MPRLLIAASGTGGHLFPALAVAEALPPSWKVTWLGVPNRLETELLPKKYRLITVRAGGLQHGNLRRICQVLKLVAAARKVRELHRAERIHAVFTTGGYIAAPAILGAIWCGIPVVLHESNAYPGKVTRLLGRFCNRLALGFPSAEGRISGSRTLVTGTPVRASFLSPHSLPEWVPTGAGPLIVVMGGSQGALGLNLMVRAVLPSLLEQGCRVVHLTGHNDSDESSLGHKNFVQRAFSDEIPALLQHADLAISRAGAGALSELAACTTPAVLVPYPSATDKHQDFNAAYAAELGAAVIVHQHSAEANTLLETVNRLLKNRITKTHVTFDPLNEMKIGMKKLAIKDSQKVIVQILNGFA